MNLFVRGIVLAALTSSAAAHAETFSRAETLKNEIRAIALSNLGNRDNLEETRALLNPLVEELAGYHAPLSAEADLPSLEGAWKEIYSDDVEPEPPGFKTDRDSTYQVITRDGYFYNLANLKGAITVLGVLRGQYKPVGDFLEIEFTRVAIRPNALSEKEDLSELAKRIEAGKVFTIVPPGNNRAPKGPVGAQGNIRNIYIDADFRVATGSNFADGVQDLYVLDKVNNPIRYAD